MAGSVSSSFSVPSCVPQNLIKGRHSKRSAFCRIPSLAPRKTVSNLLALDSINTEIFSVNWSHHRCLTATSMQLGEILLIVWM
ncbi:hypothetical protein SLEP1_g28918 [Rubroshorea leprosula]|uniref:Uncharacterized protein n=1 Tax=Rubroshorea leprosula TaxID=152421 RepID=A0AAV5K4J7_9ROSI|nr:hypothetical protein SLEP1_g28918 [Rubroshorea leprosula]